MSAILIRNGRIIDPVNRSDDVNDIFIKDDTIESIGSGALRCAAAYPSDELIELDANGFLIFPGFIDMHVHFREPGQTAKEDINSGSQAAARGGFTTVLAMPNTIPPVDNAELASYVHTRSIEVGLCDVLQVGAITHGMKGEELSDIDGMVKVGIPALSEDGKSVMDSGLLRDAMIKAKSYNIPILSHCEDINLVRGGVMNSGKTADALGLNGISNAVENIIEARDIMLAEETGATLHLCHCSTKESYEIVSAAKAKGIRVSAEVCPHHFTLCEDDIPNAIDTNYKMNPPLRTKEDREALRQGLKDGIFEVISTDHAPHTAEEKAGGFTSAPFGIVGLETSAALTYTELVLGGYLDVFQMAEKMSLNPARILGLSRGILREGGISDLNIFDPNDTYEIHSATFAGKGRNMPYEGRRVTGRIKATIYRGRISYNGY